MKKILLTSFVVFVCSFFVFSQNVDEEKTKMEKFASKTGVVSCIQDFNLEDMYSLYGTDAKTRIRKLSSGGETLYFYQIEKEGSYDTKIASIEYSDVVEVIKAITVLSEQQSEDKALNPDYLENKFITEDGFQVGYYVSGGDSNWFIILEKYGSDNTFFSIKSSIVEGFESALNKIELLKSEEAK